MATMKIIIGLDTRPENIRISRLIDELDQLYTRILACTGRKMSNAPSSTIPATF
jgi:UDP-N-acetylglucosamine 2-epimerase